MGERSQLRWVWRVSSWLSSGPWSLVHLPLQSSSLSSHREPRKSVQCWGAVQLILEYPRREQGQASPPVTLPRG